MLKVLCNTLIPSFYLVNSRDTVYKHVFTCEGKVENSVDPDDCFHNRIYGPRHKKTCLQGFANNKGADQPVHPRSLISTFVIRLLESIISRLPTSEILIF